MESEDNGPASPPKSKVKEGNGPVSRPKAKVKDDSCPANHAKSKVIVDNNGPASHSRARSLRQKVEVDTKEQIVKTRGEKRRAPSTVTLRDEEKQPSDVEGCYLSSVAKQQLHLHNKKHRVEPKQEMKREKRSAPKHVEEYKCDIEGCSMNFGTKQELSLQKRNICPVKNCRKKFFSHRYLLQHRKVHTDDRPLKCPWKGCDTAFKWQWARTEHMRVHTGDRPYVCDKPGCEQTFRFVSDFSRHKRRTGHLAKKAKTER